jgi:hypothetical protein
MAVIFNPQGYQTVSFDGALLRCGQCHATSRLKADADGSVLLDGRCESCRADVARVIEPGPNSVRE